MAVTIALDETTPAASEALSLGDDKIRELKQAIRQRMNNGGVTWESGGAIDTDAGFLACGVQGTTGVLQAIQDEAGNVILTVRDSTDGGGNKEFEFGTGLSGAQLYQVIAYELIGRRVHEVAIPLPVGGTGRVDGIYLFNSHASEEMTIEAVNLYANTGPTGTALNVDAHLHTSGWSDLSSGGTSIASDGTTLITIAASAGLPAKATEVTTFESPWPGAGADNTIGPGEVLAFEVDQLSSADDIILFIRYRREG